jgi:methionyl-tRNA formyltransferase
MSDLNARVVLLTSYLTNYHLIASWAQRHNHQLVLVVTLPRDTGRRYGDEDLVAGVDREHSVLITSQLRKVAAPAIAGMAPDLVISAAFPRLIPHEILEIPTYGAVNLHPSALPAGRGPNPFRLVYEGDDTIGATLHRTDATFDTGPVLSQRQRPLPQEVSGPALRATLVEMFAEVIEEGTAQALAGKPGTPQGEAAASYAAPFTTEEELIDFTNTAAVICRKVAALNIVTPRARFHLPGNDGTALHAYKVPFEGGTDPGTTLDTHNDGWTVQATDSAVRIITAQPPESTSS